MITKYIDFINELRITSRVSGSGSTREIDTILDEPVDNKSLSAAILLKNKLKEEEFQSDLVKIIGMDSDIPPENSTKFKKWLGGRQKDDRLLISINNLNFLKKEMKRLGTLKCEYCGKSPLVIYDPFTKNVNVSYSGKFSGIGKEKFNKSDGATCDHKEPISKGGSKFAIDNLAVCCHRCNQLKSNMSYNEWIFKLNTKNESSKFTNMKNDISDLFTEVSDKYSITEVIIDDFISRNNLLINHFSIIDYGDTHGGDTQFLFQVYMSNIDKEYADKFEIDFKQFQNRLRKFGFLISEYPYWKYSNGYVFPFTVSKDLKK